jgi:hypothetical protein
LHDAIARFAPRLQALWNCLVIVAPPVRVKVDAQHPARTFVVW